MFKREAVTNFLVVLVPIITLGLIAIWLLLSRQEELHEKLQEQKSAIGEKRIK
jgi:hypothetical protein